MERLFQCFIAELMQQTLSDRRQQRDEQSVHQKSGQAVRLARSESSPRLVGQAMGTFTALLQTPR